MKVLDYKIGGNSFPIVVKDQHNKYLIKLKAGLSGEYSIISEWFGNCVGAEIGLNTRKPIWISLDNSLDYKKLYIEVRDLIEKSMGTNIAFTYIDQLEELSINELNPVDFLESYLVDVIMLNIDRTIGNTNLLKDKNGSIIISDYESSLLFNELIYSVKPSNDTRILQCLRANVFYQKIKEKDVVNFVNKLNNINFDKLIDQLPQEILDINQKQLLKLKLNQKKKEEWNLKSLLSKIDSIKLETQEAKQKRIKANRDKLLRLVENDKKSSLK